MSHHSLTGLSSQILATILPPLDDASSTPVAATNLKVMGSFNWIEQENPIIAVPGAPTKWIERTLPVHLNKEFNRPFFDESISRKYSCSLEPDLIAIQVTQATLGVQDFDLSKESIDIVTNRNNLRKLLEFATSGAGSGSRSTFSRYNNFRIDAQLAPNGRTLVLTKYEPPADSAKQITDQNSFDHIFERTCTNEHPLITATEADGRTITLRRVGYYRTVRYDLLGMRFLVRSRVDAMIEATSEVDQLAKALETTRLDAPSDPAPIPVVQAEGSSFRYIELGECVPQDKLLDIKVVTNGRIKWHATYPQFFLSQTPNLKVAIRGPRNGRQYVTQMYSYTPDSLQAEHERQSGQFRKLVNILGQMRTIMQTHASDSPLAFVLGQGEIKVYQIVERGPYLSDEGLDKF